MSFSLFEFLRISIPKTLDETRTKRFYDLHSHLLSRYEETRPYLDSKTYFQMIKANIIIRSLWAKKKTEEKAALAAKAGVRDERKAINEVFPYIQDGDQKIIIAFFSKNINKHYTDKISSLNKMPYKALRSQKSFSSFYKDPFSKYGYAIFSSNFTRLIPIMESPTGESMAFVDLDVETIYIIDSKGNLEEEIPFFDINLQVQDRSSLISKVHKLVESYYDYSEDDFIEQLKSLGFISEILYKRIELAKSKDEKKKG